MSPIDDDPVGDVQREMEDTARKMDRESERLEQDIDGARKELSSMERATGGEVAGDWREADETGENEDDETRREGESS